MIAVFDEEESRFLRRLFAYSVEDPLSLRAVDLSILGPGPLVADSNDPLPVEDGIVGLLSRLSVEGKRDRADLAERVAAVMLVGYRRGFFKAIDQASLPTPDDFMEVAELYPGLEEACSQHSFLESSSAVLRVRARLESLQGHKGLVSETLGLFNWGLQRSTSQGYRTGALVACALRGGAASKLADASGIRDAIPDDPEQNSAVADWLAGLAWDDLQREIMYHQTADFWSRLQRAARAPVRLGLPAARDDWTEASDDFMADLLVVIAQSGIWTGMRLHLQKVSHRPSLPSSEEVRLTYRVFRSVALLSRQWSSWHPAPAKALRIRQVGDHLTAPTFASGAVLGIMMARVLEPPLLPKPAHLGN